MMKQKNVVAALAAVMLVAIAMSNAQAAITTHMNEVSFLATNSQESNLSIETTYYTNSPGELMLEYSTDGGDNFTSVNASAINLDDVNSAIISFRLVDSNNQSYTGGELTFSGGDNQYLFNSLSILWDTLNFDITFTAVLDGGTRISPTPIPAPALLLCTGLIGLIAYRRRGAGPV